MSQHEINERKEKMLMTKFSDDFYDINTLVNRMFSDVRFPNVPTYRSTTIDVNSCTVDDKGATWEIDLPGVSRENLSIELLNQHLNITATRDSNKKIEFRKLLQVTQEFDASKAEAKLTNGVLTLFVPRRDETVPKRVKIEVK